jgi:NAD(P)-dependent dehydrogenase (short-subunit alcohol dehydrogenase family)
LCLYGASKSAQLKLVKNIAPYLAPFGVTVNCVTPGAINTPRNEAVLSDGNFKQKVEKSIPCGYIGEPSDISPSVLLLASEEGRYITGTEIIVDGGMSL